MSVHPSVSLSLKQNGKCDFFGRYFRQNFFVKISCNNGHLVCILICWSFSKNVNYFFLFYDLSHNMCFFHVKKHLLYTSLCQFVQPWFCCFSLIMDIVILVYCLNYLPTTPFWFEFLFNSEWQITSLNINNKRVYQMLWWNQTVINLFVFLQTLNNANISVLNDYIYIPICLSIFYLSI